VDLSPTEAQAMMQRSARELFEDRFPLSVVRAMESSSPGFSPEFWRDMGRQGWAGLGIPEEFGGEGGSLLDVALLYEEFGRACAPLPHLASTVLCGLTLLAAGSDEQKRRHLPKIADGSERWAFAFTEPEHGWEAEDVRLPASHEGGGFVLHGRKHAVPYAAGADYLLVAARTGGGVTLFAVPGGAAGVSMRALPGWDEESLFEITFDHARVGADSVIGAVDGGWDAIAGVLDQAVMAVCAYAAGGAQKIAEMGQDYGRGRIQFGVPIGSFQRVQDRLLITQDAADAARFSAYEAIWKLESGMADAREAVSLAKIIASDGFVQGCEETHHVFAGYGADRALGLWQYTRKARTLFSFLGDPDHHRARLASLLGM
jgi:alkylation response protein AidB-like acyl-CoA dehydrogenase